MRIISIVFLLIQAVLNAQGNFVLRHSHPGGTAGVLTITPSGDASGSENYDFKAKVREITVSFSGSKDITLMMSAALIEEKMPDMSRSGASASIKSYTDPDYERKVEYEISEDGEEGQEIVRVQDETKVEDVPPKTYVEFRIGDDVLEYSFYDRSGLESIVNSVNGSYGTNFEVAGEGRNVSVGRSAPKKEIIERDVSARVTVTDAEYTEGTQIIKAGIDPRLITESLVNDKVLTKKMASSFTLGIDTDYIYINGSRIQDNLLVKYRKLLGGFFFEYSD